MFTTKTPDEPTKLEEAIDMVESKLKDAQPETPEFGLLVNRLEQLYTMKPNKKAQRVSTDVLVTVAGNLAGIVLILGFERAHVMTSKALSFVLKSRV